MTAVPASSIEDLREKAMDPQFLSLCAGRLGRPEDEIRRRIVTAWSEAQVAFSLLGDIDLSGKRVLEVGAGIGFVSVLLQQQGVEITAIEPGSGGFDMNERIGACLREWLKVSVSPVLDIGAEALEPGRHGPFDLIFSVNVLEHIPDLEGAVDAMCGVLRPGGVMRHTCPNYTLPYEPHFGILLVPFAPRLTERLVPGVRGTEVWDSLKFVTLPRIRRAFRRNGLACRFAKGTLYEAFARLEQDPVYRARQGGNRAVALSYALLRRLGVLGLLAHCPPILATPMTFEVRRTDGPAGSGGR